MHFVAGSVVMVRSALHALSRGVLQSQKVRLKIVLAAVKDFERCATVRDGCIECTAFGPSF